MRPNMTTGVLLINLGTPTQPDVPSVRRYLHEFLSDPRVIDIPWLLRALLVDGFILPFRPKQSANAYRAIWTPQGSPLRIISEQCQQQVQQQLGTDFHVTLGMRYGTPSIKTAIQQLNHHHCEHIIILPLFPHYSSAATGSAIEKALSLIQTQQNIPSLSIIHNFYQHPQFINTYAQLIQRHTQNMQPDFYLFSYHGIPERQIIKSETNEKITCDRLKPCPAINTNNHFCYRAQCYASTTLIAKTLNLPEECYQTSFQSRLGRTPWIKPYTDETLPQLYQRGIRHLAIVCPSFVSDCLETLEEIGIRAKQQWQQLGGTQLTLIPSLNAEPAWITTLCNIIKERS
jgi:protoporphyrin/coproporphyrin ferrochelatase